MRPLRCRRIIGIAAAVFFTGWFAGQVYGQGRARVYQDSLLLYLVDIQKKARPARPEIMRFYGDALFPNFTYGSSRTNFNRKKQRFKAVTLENSRLVLKQAVDLGGQIFLFQDKQTGKDVLMSSPSPNVHITFALRKGAQIAFPYAEHSFNSLEPWPFSTGEDERGAFTAFSKKDPASGLVCEFVIVMPHTGYYIDLYAFMFNPTDKPQKGMLWSLHALDYKKGLRVFFPTQNVVSHTALDITSPQRTAQHAIGFMTPFKFPLIDGVDLANLANWPSYAGMYASERSNTWCALHNIVQRRGFVKIPDPATRGLKFYADIDHAELFSGSTPSFEHYAPIAPDDTVRLRERIIPTTGAVWISEVTNRGFAGLYRSENRLYGEFMLCDNAGLEKSAVSATLKQNAKKLAATERTLEPGQSIRLSTPIPATRLNDKISLVIVNGRKPLVKAALPWDSIPVLNEIQLTGMPLDSVRDNQASAYTLPQEKKDRQAAQSAPGKISGSVRRIFTLEKRNDPTALSNRLISMRQLPTLQAPAAAVRAGDTTFVLCKDALSIAVDNAPHKPQGVTYGTNSSSYLKIDSVFKDSNFISITQIPIDMEWYGDIERYGNSLLLTIDKRLEIRGLTGSLQNSIELPSWGGAIAVNNEKNIAITLPFKQAIAEVSLSSRTVTSRSLKPFNCPYPWGLAALPSGWAVGSATHKRVLVADRFWQNGKTIDLPARPPWQKQFKGLGDLLWHPDLRALLICDLDNMCIHKASLDGTMQGLFARSGLNADETRLVHDLTLDTLGSVLVTQSLSKRNPFGAVKRFTLEGRFTGVIGLIQSGIAQNPFCSAPYGENRLLSFDAAEHSLAISDLQFLKLAVHSGHGWGEGMTVGAAKNAELRSAQVFAFDQNHGAFIADYAKHRIIVYTPELDFADELHPPKAAHSFAPVALILDHKGSIHALDGFRNRIFRFDKKQMRHGNTTRYVFRKSYKPHNNLRCQRMYRHHNSIVLVDVVSNTAQYVKRNGRLTRTVKLPARSAASIHWVETPEGHLAIKDQLSPQALVIPTKGRPFLTSAIGLAGDIISFYNLQAYPRWKPEKAPDDAVYACIDEEKKIRYLDSRFDIIREPSTQLRSIKAGDLTSILYTQDTLIAGVNDYPGVVVTNQSRIAPLWIPLNIKARHIVALAIKNDSTFGALTEAPVRYVEFDNTGVVKRSIPTLPVSESHCFAYNKAGELLLPDNKTFNLHEIDSTGTIQRQISIAGIPSVQNIAVDSSGDALLLDMSGRLFRVVDMQKVEMLFSGRIEKKTAVNHISWMHLVRDKMIIGAPQRLGIAAIGLDGRFYGAIPLPEGVDKLGASSLTADGTIVFIGNEKIYEAAIRF